MTDNTQGLDEILRRLVNRVEQYAFQKWDSQPKDYPPGVRDVLFTQDMEDEAAEALLDWHNKQIDKILAHDFFKYCQGCSCAAADLLEAERERLKRH